MAPNLSIIIINLYETVIKIYVPTGQWPLPKCDPSKSTNKRDNTQYTQGVHYWRVCVCVCPYFIYSCMHIIIKHLLQKISNEFHSKKKFQIFSFLFFILNIENCIHFYINFFLFFFFSFAGLFIRSLMFSL